MRCPSCGASLPVEDIDCTRCGASVGWWVRPHGATEVGPFSFLQMQELTRQGRLGPLDRVRIGLVGDWVRAPEVLSPSFQRAEPQPPQAVAHRPRPHPGRILLGVGVGVSATVLLVTAGLLILARGRRPVQDPAGQVCAANLQQLARALRMYAQDHGDAFPPWESWIGAAQTHVATEGVLICPAAPGEPGYAYNATLSGWYNGQVRRPDRCVLLWDAGALGPSVGLSVTGGAARHRGGDNYAFVDGHTSWRPRGRYPPADVELRP